MLVACVQHSAIVTCQLNNFNRFGRDAVLKNMAFGQTERLGATEPRALPQAAVTMAFGQKKKAQAMQIQVWEVG
ncbi:hypothetical protein SAMN06265222_12416 [Neorhodopirellula lusitana]|uniref:Uncharacterized protein n=1 Tax=Neorhodopirellula lusitana TaxID=445327 RepID=A0ABY1QR21_9BACT|nr:hypothetical protein SAMN06265222_12416 [Neorhodopirellula lusitana]